MRRFLITIKTICCCIACFATLVARSQTTDSISVHKNRRYTKKEINEMWIAPTALFAASALTWPLREDIRELRNRYIPNFEMHYDDYAQYVPLAVVVGLEASGVKGKHKPARALVSYAFSAVIMATLVNSIKYTAKVERPDGSQNNSFPSGHTANSFMNATILHKEYGQYRHPLFTVLGYTISTGTAVGRELNNRHWVSDVLAGAGIGILSTHLGYLVTDKIMKDKGINPPLRSQPLPVGKKPSFIEARLGFSTALTDDLATKTALKAKNGFNMGLNGAWFYHKNFGIGAEFAFSSFPINSDDFKYNYPEIDTVAASVYTQPMGVRYLHVASYFSIPLMHNWFITAQIGAGGSTGARGNVMVTLKEEYQEIFGVNELPMIVYKPESAFSWNAGAGIQKRLTRNIALKLYANYFNSDHDFDIDGLADIDTDGKYIYDRIGTDKVKFDHLTFGLAVTAFIW